jgi:hypothetical protein
MQQESLLPQTRPPKTARMLALVCIAAACRQPPAAAVAPVSTAVSIEEPLPRPQETPMIIAGATPRCSPADWSLRQLAPLLKPGKSATPSRPDRQGARPSAFTSECTDAPQGPRYDSPAAVVLDGVEIRLASATPAGSTGRRWIGNQCAFDVRLADASGPTVRLGADDVPPFAAVSALVRSGSAAWLTVGFNGYTAEFPKGGNRIVALDLCSGRVVWRSKDAMSNGGLLLLDDYLISPYGFTSERRYVYVLDSHSGTVVQKLPVIENVCPSKSWAPNWHPGERCDAPGQKVGAATDPRVERGVFLVDTNTGSSSFEFQ